MKKETTSSITEDQDVSVREMIINLQEWIRYLISKWVVFLIVGFVGGGLGLWYALVNTTNFTARTSFVVESGDSRGGLGNLAGVAAMAGINLGGNAGGLFQGDNILELYRSRTMLAKTLLSPIGDEGGELLIDRFVDYNDLRTSWGEDPRLSSIDFHKDSLELTVGELRTRDSLITRFVKYINEDVLNVGKPDKSLSIIQVEVTSPDEEFSKVFNETLVKEVNEFYVQTKTKKSSNNIAILEAKVDSVRNVMTGAIYSAARTADVTANLNPTRQSQRTAPTQEAQFAAEANRAMLSQLLQNLELARMAQLQEQPLIQLIDTPVYPLPVDELGKAKGIIIGGFLAGFLTLLALIALKWYRDVMREDDESSAL